MPNITFSKLFNTEITGLYSLSYRLLASPMGIIMSAIGQVFYKEASVIHTKNTKKLFKFLKNFYLNTFLIGIIPFAILFFISPYLFPIILGDEWKMSGIYIQLLIPWLFLVFLNSPVTSILIILKKQKELFYYEFTSMITRVIVVLSALFLKNSLYTVGLYSFTGFLFSLFLLVYIIKRLKIAQKFKRNNFLFYHISYFEYMRFYIIESFSYVGFNSDFTNKISIISYYIFFYFSHHIYKSSKTSDFIK